jgi:hypothetical protein
MLETGFGTGLVGTAKPGNAPVYIDVDDNPLAIEGARSFEHDSTTAASAQWHCKHVEVAQLILLTTSSIQFFLGLILSFAVIGILPLVSSILGLVSSIQYFLGEVSTLEKTLSWVRLPAVLTRCYANA